MDLDAVDKQSALCHNFLCGYPKISTVECSNSLDIVAMYALTFARANENIDAERRRTASAYARCGQQGAHRAKAAEKKLYQKKIYIHVFIFLACHVSNKRDSFTFISDKMRKALRSAEK